MSVNKFSLFALMLLFAFSASLVIAQDDDDTDGLGGVKIDTDGVFQSKLYVDRSGELDAKRMAAAQAKLSQDIVKSSKLRKISVNRLEAAAKKLRAAGKPLPPEMQYLAGMTRLSHVFYLPETKDIVIAGPAEGFFLSSQERVVGMKSGQAVLQLQDLVVALRAYAPDSKPTRTISCSIDPTQQGLANFRQAVVTAQNEINARQGDVSANEIANYFQQSMGLHQVTIKGVSPRTHFAQVLVDADYHMKRIGIGLEQPPVRITSYIEKAQPGAGKNGLQRWYFRPDYDYLKVSEDETALHLDGGGVELVGENEIVSANGQRKATGRKGSRASRAFCSSFTKMYNRLAEKMPVFAELRNAIDLSVAAAFIHEMDFYGEANWDLDFFGNESLYPVEKFTAPKSVTPAINAVWKSGQLMTPIGGGVNIQPRVALTSDNMKKDESGNVDKVKKSIDMSDVKSDQWWWD